MFVNQAKNPLRDSAGGVFLDDALLERLRQSSDKSQFSKSWLHALSGVIEGMTQAVLVTSAPGQSRFEPLAVWPDKAKPERALMSGVEACLRGMRSMIMTQPSDEGGGAVVAVPILVAQQIRGVVAVVVTGRDEASLRLVIDQLQWSSGWIETLLRRGRVTEGDGLATVVELLATSLHHRGFEEAATATVTELALHLGCERVAVGFLRGRHMRLSAMSHSANFGKRSNITRSIEAAMDEAADQKATIVTPQPTDAQERATLRHDELMRTQDMSAVCTVPIFEDAQVIGALLLERSEPFDRASIQLCEHAAALLGPTLDSKRREDRFLLIKALESMKNLIWALFGPRHAVLKLVTLIFIGLVVFFSTASGTYRVTGDAVVEGQVQRTVAAPVAGYLQEASARAGDRVREGEVIATLDMTDLRLDKLKWSSQRAKQEREYSEALARKERSRARILEAQIQQATAQLALLDQQINRMRITAPFYGLILTGDLSQLLGSPVERGDELFTIAPLNDYRVTLQADERDVGDLEVGQTGTIALSALPDERIAFEVAAITPVSTAEEGLNFFEVKGTVDTNAASILRPGMEGVAKVEVGEELLIWIWTRKLVLWAKMFAWSWTP